MWKTLLPLALLTGVFCSGFAVFMNWATMQFGLGEIIGLSFISGFLGSLFSNLIIRPWRAKQEV